MTPLPEAIGSVVIPETFTVTQVVSTQDCFLRSVLDTRRYTESQLKSNPFAELGRISHALVEATAREALRGQVVSTRGIELKLERLIAEYQTQSRRHSKSENGVDLPRTMTPLAWERKKRTIVDLALGYSIRMKRIHRDTSKSRKKRLSFQDAIGNGRWFEVPIHVQNLRLKGRMDILERTTEELRITDLKFGNIKDANGCLKPRIEMQLRLYGLMVTCLDKSANPSLYVNDGALNPVPFDNEIAEKTAGGLRSLTDELPSGSVVKAEALSKVGQECRWCLFRHRCAKYLNDAPTLWPREIEWPLPPDTWGRVDRLSMRNWLTEMTLTDAGGRSVKIFGVRNRHLSNVEIGSYVWLFDLAASRTSHGVTAWRHPLNFHEIDVHNELDQAWSFQIFTDADRS